jgi:hypothetical protein
MNADSCANLPRSDEVDVARGAHLVTVRIGMLLRSRPDTFVLDPLDGTENEWFQECLRLHD